MSRDGLADGIGRHFVALLMGYSRISPGRLSQWGRGLSNHSIGRMDHECKRNAWLNGRALILVPIGLFLAVPCLDVKPGLRQNRVEWRTKPPCLVGGELGTTECWVDATATTNVSTCEFRRHWSVTRALRQTRDSSPCCVLTIARVMAPRRAA